MDPSSLIYVIANDSNIPSCVKILHSGVPSFLPSAAQCELDRSQQSSICPFDVYYEDGRLADDLVIDEYDFVVDEVGVIQSSCLRNTFEVGTHHRTKCNGIGQSAPTDVKTTSSRTLNHDTASCGSLQSSDSNKHANDSSLSVVNDSEFHQNSSTEKQRTFHGSDASADDSSSYADDDDEHQDIDGVTPAGCCIPTNNLSVGNYQVCDDNDESYFCRTRASVLATSHKRSNRRSDETWSAYQEQISVTSAVENGLTPPSTETDMSSDTEYSRVDYPVSAASLSSANQTVAVKNLRRTVDTNMPERHAISVVLDHSLALESDEYCSESDDNENISCKATSSMPSSTSSFDELNTMKSKICELWRLRCELKTSLSRVLNSTNRTTHDLQTTLETYRDDEFSCARRSKLQACFDEIEEREAVLHDREAQLAIRKRLLQEQEQIVKSRALESRNSSVAAKFVSVKEAMDKYNRFFSQSTSDCDRRAKLNREKLRATEPQVSTTESCPVSSMHAFPKRHCQWACTAPSTARRSGRRQALSGHLSVVSSSPIHCRQQKQQREVVAATPAATSVVHRTRGRTTTVKTVNRYAGRLRGVVTVRRQCIKRLA